MVPRQSAIQNRKERILGIVVNEYIQTVNPISSGYIAKKYRFNLSSATLRNILAELEVDGLLTHPHTSAGRVPTEEGYRYYVDHLMDEIALLEEHKRCIKLKCEQERRNLASLVERTSEVLSDLTKYTSIVTIEGVDGRLFCKGSSYVVGYPDYQDLQKIQGILAVLDEKERILELINRKLRKKIQIFIGHELACRNVEDCSMAVSAYQLHNGVTGRIAVLGPKRMNYQKVVSALDYISELIQEMY